MSTVRKGDMIRLCFNGCRSNQTAATLGDHPREVLAVSLDGFPIVQYLWRSTKIISWVRVPKSP